MLLLLPLERAFGAVSILDGYVLRHFPGLPGMPVRRIIEPIQLVGAELVSPADVFTEVTARRRGIEAKPQQDARQADLVPVRKPVAFALGLAQAGIKIFAGATISDRLKPGEVIDATRFHFNLVHRLVQDVGNLLHSHPHAVTQPDASRFGERRNRIAYLMHRVGVVEQDGVGADALHCAGDVDHSLHGTQGMEERPRPAVLGENLTETIFARDVVVLCPIKASLDLDCSDYKLRAVERGLQGSGRADLGAATELFGKRFGVAADFQQLVGDDVHETQVDAALCEHVAEQDITHGFGAKGAAAGANQSNDDRFHAQTPLQTMAGFGGGAGAADTSSSTVPLGAEISMSASSWRTSPSRPRASRHSRASSLVGASTAACAPARATDLRLPRAFRPK